MRKNQSAASDVQSVIGIHGFARSDSAIRIDGDDDVTEFRKVLREIVVTVVIGGDDIAWRAYSGRGVIALIIHAGICAGAAGAMIAMKKNEKGMRAATGDIFRPECASPDFGCSRGENFGIH